MNSLFHMVKQVRYIGVIHLILFDKLPCSINKIQGLVGSPTAPTNQEIDYTDSDLHHNRGMCIYQTRLITPFQPHKAALHHNLGMCQVE